MSSFTPAAKPADLPQQGESPLCQYFLNSLERFMRPPAGVLRHPFLTPGGSYLDQLWDWDSYWVSTGLFELARRTNDRELFQRVLEHSRGSLANFFENQASNGTVPILVVPNAGDFFRCSDENALEFNQAKPVFAQFALKISDECGDASWFAPYFDGLMRFEERWLQKYGTACGLLVWGSDVAIGVDNDPTTYGRPFFSSANLLLNCFYYADLCAAIEMARRLGREREVSCLAAWADRVGRAISSRCWDSRDRFFYTVDVQCKDQRDLLIPEEVPRGMEISWDVMPLKIQMFTGFLPMWCGLANPDQAIALIGHYRNPASFFGTYGVRTLSGEEGMYAPHVESANPSNWLGPVWIVANYLIWKGLLRYGYREDATILANKTRALLERDLAKTGAIHECYHPDTGEPNENIHFMSWNLLALEMMGGPTPILRTGGL